MLAPRQWDVFCKVIDNWGDLGVAWRLCADLAQRGEQVRLWVDQPAALAWMAPHGAPGVQVMPWNEDSATRLTALPPTDVLVEAFGCHLDDALCHHFATQAAQWINLEYLSAERYVLRQHGLPSPVMSGPARGRTKHFYFPGFTAGTGGLLRERDLLERQHRFDARSWLASMGVAHGARAVSLFCYEPPALAALLRQLAGHDSDTVLLVTAGRAAAALQRSLQGTPALHDATTGERVWSRLRVRLLPLLTQPEFDHLLWSCDLNFVRGEDSLVRALWAGKPFVWNIYPQDDGAHGAKLEAFLDAMEAPDSLRQAHLAWNGLGGLAWPESDLALWGDMARTARRKLLEQSDLVTQLFGFLQEHR